MSLVKLELPLFALERGLKALEIIAECCQRAFPSPYADPSDERLKPPEPGLSIVSNEDVAEDRKSVV